MRCPKNHTNETFAVIHPPTMRSMEDWKRWVLLPYFDRRWRELGLDDDDLNALQIMVMIQPKSFPIVPGTGGLRKARFARKGQGKSGGYRVGFAYFEEYGVIAAIAVYAKKDEADIPAAQRAVIKELIGRLERWLADGG